MAGIDGDAVAFEHGIHLADNISAGRLDAVELQHSVDVVGEEPVWVDGALVVVHGTQVYTRGHDDRCRSLGASDGAAHFFLRIGAGAKAGDGLDNGAATGAFDEIEHEQFRGRDLVLEERWFSFHGGRIGEV